MRIFALLAFCLSLYSVSAWAAVSKCEFNLFRHRFSHVTAIYSEKGAVSLKQLRKVVNSPVPMSPLAGLSRLLEYEHAFDFFDAELAAPETARDWNEICAELRVVLAVKEQEQAIEERAREARAAVLYPMEVKLNFPDTFIVDRWFKTRDGRLLYVVAEQNTQTVQQILEFPSGKPVWTNHSNTIGPFAALEENAQGGLQIVEFSRQLVRENGWNQFLRTVFDTTSNTSVARDRFWIKSSNGAADLKRLRAPSDLVVTGYGALGLLGKGAYLKRPDSQDEGTIVELSPNPKHQILNGNGQDFLLRKDRDHTGTFTTIEFAGGGEILPVHKTPFAWPENYEQIKGLQLPDGRFALAASDRGSGRGFYFHSPAFDGGKKAEFFKTGDQSEILELVMTQEEHLLVFVRVRDGSGSQLRIYEPARSKAPIFSTHIQTDSDFFIHYSYLNTGGKLILSVVGGTDNNKTLYLYEPLKSEDEIGNFVQEQDFHKGFLFPGENGQIYLIGQIGRLVHAYTLFNTTRRGPSSTAQECDLRLMHPFSLWTKTVLERELVKESAIRKVIESKVPRSPLVGQTRMPENGSLIDFFESQLENPHIAEQWPAIVAEIGSVLRRRQGEMDLSREASHERSSVILPKPIGIPILTQDGVKSWLSTRGGRVLYANEKFGKTEIREFPSGDMITRIDHSEAKGLVGLEESETGDVQAVFFFAQPRILGWGEWIRTRGKVRYVRRILNLNKAIVRDDEFFIPDRQSNFSLVRSNYGPDYLEYWNSDVLILSEPLRFMSFARRRREVFPETDLPRSFYPKDDRKEVISVRSLELGNGNRAMVAKVAEKVSEAISVYRLNYLGPEGGTPVTLAKTNLAHSFRIVKTESGRILVVVAGSDAKIQIFEPARSIEPLQAIEAPGLPSASYQFDVLALRDELLLVYANAAGDLGLFQIDDGGAAENVGWISEPGHELNYPKLLKGENNQVYMIYTSADDQNLKLIHAYALRNASRGAP